MLAHHTITGCNMRVGDMCGTGTISGPTPDSLGSLLEISKGGKNPLTLPDGSTRTVMENGDVLTIRGWAGKDGERIGFGEVSGEVES